LKTASGEAAMVMEQGDFHLVRLEGSDATDGSDDDGKAEQYFFDHGSVVLVGGKRR